MNRFASQVITVWALAGTLTAAAPFGATATLDRGSATDAVVTVRIAVPAKHHLYADAFSISAAGGVGIAHAELPAPVTKYDPLSEENRAMYERDIVAQYLLTGALVYPLAVTVRYQGCDETTCYMPATAVLSVGQAMVSGQTKTSSLSNQYSVISDRRGSSGSIRGTEAAPTLEALRMFRERSRGVGFMPADKFLAFLAARDTAPANEAGRALAAFSQRGLLLSLLLILLGGLALNLTPCVLPMMPINLAIIGAGTQAGSRLRGLALGGVYGLGIAVAYGALGVVVVLTGAQFGVLNSAAWFNFLIAAVFVVLALAMFDLVQIDFTRYQHAAVGARVKKGGFVTAYLVGTVAALLAGACVAPVVIQVLVLATTLYGRGVHAGLLLPFVLGLGMALPWPLAGAGLAWLPKPGAWMVRVKQGFGVLILAMALWYGYEGFRIARGAPAAVADGIWRTSLPAALAEAQRTHKPVLIDFWATWCKNCMAMDKTTFKDARVRAALAAFIPVKVQTEQFSDPRVKPFIDYFNIMGLPTYIVIETN
ncbi:MAG: thioredoxin family protein [bacterium]|nr:thioredoxin family protein [bacterium]